MLTEENRYVAEQILRSGFPLEIELSELLEARHWEVMPSVSYYDFDLDEFREIDLLAYKTIARSVKDAPNYPYEIVIALVIECKKREGVAWVFFPRPRRSDDLDYGGVGLAAIDSFQVARISSIGVMYPLFILPRHIGFNLKPKAFVPADIARNIWGAHEKTGMAEARSFRCLSLTEKALSYDAVRLKKPDPDERQKSDRDFERKQIHEALNGLAKATDDRLAKEAEMLQAFLDGTLNYADIQPQLWKFRLIYFFPVLVLDGKLKAWNKGTVSDAREVLCQVSLRSKNYFHDRLVTIITKQAFGEWLDQLEADTDQLVKKVMSQRKQLDEQVELLRQHRIRPFVPSL